MQQVEQAKFTPGPWGFKDHGHRGTDGPTGFRIEPAFMHYVIAEIFDYGPEGEANAHLIAAAPEVLEAAETMLSRFDEAKSSYGFVTKADLAQLRAAIAKATGAQS